MDVKGKTKDNDKARKDLSLYCWRPDLELKLQSNGKILKPKANYTLTNEESKLAYQWIKELRMPDGYSSNLARCVDVDKGRIHGMKSHDCHIFIECLLPIVFSALPVHVLNPLVELSHFFKDLCSTTLRDHNLVRMEENISIILCKLERIFPMHSLIQWNTSRFILQMKQDLVDQFNIDGCIHSKGMTKYHY